MWGCPEDTAEDSQRLMQISECSPSVDGPQGRARGRAERQDKEDSCSSQGSTTALSREPCPVPDGGVQGPAEGNLRPSCPVYMGLIHPYEVGRGHLWGLIPSLPGVMTHLARERAQPCLADKGLSFSFSLQVPSFP